MMMDSEQPIYRFSQSPIWELQRAYFEEQGIHAWQSEEVPQYISSNPIMAKAYAEMIFGFLRDRARLGFAKEPVYILELGAGSGRLAYHVLKALEELKAFAGIELPPYRYIMSDLPVKNIKYWQQHASLLPFVRQGCLDFAQFDAEQETSLHLMESGLTIRPGDLRQPLLIVANYFFDSIPQELLYVDEGQIYECGISFQGAEDAGGSDEAGGTDESGGTYGAGGKDETGGTDAAGKPSLLESLKPEYHYRRADEYDKDSNAFHEVLDIYKSKLEDSHFLFPFIGIQCLERLQVLSREGFVLISADKGDHRLEHWEFRDAPKLIHHGSFSLTANYHALSHVFEQKGARAWFTVHHYNHINVGCILMLQDPATYTDTRLAYRRFVEQFGPDDFFSLKMWVLAHVTSMELDQFLSFWRLSGYDAQLLLQCVNRILDLIPDSDEEDLVDIRRGIGLMWEGYYPMDEKQDLAFDTGMILYHMQMFEEALQYFKRSLRDYKAQPAVLYNMAICHYELGADAEAVDFAKRTLVMEPEHEGALALLKLLRSE
jgi:tetratricopeptide (TPR) repeat protein